MLAHRILEALRQVKGENARLLNFLAQLIDQPVKTLVAGDLSDKSMKAVIGVEITNEIAFLAGFLE